MPQGVSFTTSGLSGVLHSRICEKAIFHPFNPIFGQFSKNPGSEHSGTETRVGLSRFVQENEKTLKKNEEISCFFVKTKK